MGCSDRYLLLPLQAEFECSSLQAFFEQPSLTSLDLRHMYKARKLQEKGWQPRWFQKDKEDDCYKYAGGYWEARKHGKWDGIPDIYDQGDTLLIAEQENIPTSNA